MIIKGEYVILFFLFCLVTGAVIVAGISIFLPVDVNIVCKDILNMTVQNMQRRCICP